MKEEGSILDVLCGAPRLGGWAGKELRAGAGLKEYWSISRDPSSQTLRYVELNDSEDAAEASLGL